MIGKNIQSLLHVKRQTTTEEMSGQDMNGIFCLRFQNNIIKSRRCFLSRCSFFLKSVWFTYVWMDVCDKKSCQGSVPESEKRIQRKICHQNLVLLRNIKWRTAEKSSRGLTIYMTNIISNVDSLKCIHKKIHQKQQGQIRTLLTICPF